MARAERQLPATTLRLLALAIPVLAGLAYLNAFGAPQFYLLINAGALAVGLIWILAQPRVSGVVPVRVAAILAIVVIALPLVTGPMVNEVSRWIPVGPFRLHAGAIAIPLLAGAAALDREYTPIWLLSAVFFAVLQPDAGTLFAICGLAIGLYFAEPDWKPGVVAIAAFMAALYAHRHGMLAPQPYVESILSDLILSNPMWALGLFLSLLSGFLLIWQFADGPLPVRAALAGAFAGFALAGILSNYPSILIGYGSSPIIGIALALGIRWRIP